MMNLATIFGTVVLPSIGSLTFISNHIPAQMAVSSTFASDNSYGYWTHKAKKAGSSTMSVGQSPSTVISIESTATEVPVPTKVNENLKIEAYFNSGESALDSKDRRVLADFVKRLSVVDIEVIQVIGHTDSEGPAAYNLSLSLRRAEAVKNYLISKGVAGHRIYAEGKGNGTPAGDDSTRDGKAKNRRVEIMVVPANTRRS